MELDSLIPKLWLSRVEGHFQLSILWLQLDISCRSLCRLTLEGFGKQAENPTDIPHPMGSRAQGGFCEDFVRTGGRGGIPAWSPILPPPPEALMHPRCSCRDNSRRNSSGLQAAPAPGHHLLLRLPSEGTRSYFWSCLRAARINEPQMHKRGLGFAQPQTLPQLGKGRAKLGSLGHLG